MPVLKLSYNEIISDAKIRILKAIDVIGGYNKQSGTTGTNLRIR
jgi:hypothetical protein